MLADRRAGRPAGRAVGGGPRRPHGFSLLELIGVVLLLGVLAGAVGLGTRNALSASDAARARSAVAWLDAAARRAGEAGRAAELRFDLSEQTVELWLDGTPPNRGNGRRVRLPGTLRLKELAFAETEAYNGVVILAAAPGGHLPTYATLTGPPRVDRKHPDRWTVRLGTSGQAFTVRDRYDVREVLRAGE